MGPLAQRRFVDQATIESSESWGYGKKLEIRELNLPDAMLKACVDQ